MARFRVLRGLHNESGRTYQAGEVVDSKSDLTKFNRPNSVKFERVLEETPAPQEAVAVAAEQELDALPEGKVRGKPRQRE